MINVSFTYGTTCTISASVVYGTDWWDERINQISLQTADGGLVTFDSGVTVCHGILVMKGVSYTHGESLKTFIKDNIIFSKYAFTIGAVVNLDLGNGKNVAVTANVDSDPSTKDMFSFVAPGNYDVKIPYRFRRS
jgi:hypothetical protein